MNKEKMKQHRKESRSCCSTCGTGFEKFSHTNSGQQTFGQEEAKKHETCTRISCSSEGSTRAQVEED